VDDPEKIEALFQRGLQAYHDKDYFLAHDHWEELWSDFYLKDRLFVQALIQISVSFVHLENKNLNGAKSLLNKALLKLEDFKGVHRGINVESLKTNLNMIQDEYEAIESGIEFNWKLIPELTKPR